MMRYPVAAILLVVSPAVFAQTATVDQCLSTFEKGKEETAPAVLRDCAEALRTASARGDRDVWNRLRRIVVNDGLKTPIRAEMLKVACEKADETIAAELVALGMSWADDLDFTRRNVESIMADERSVAKSHLLSTLVLDGFGHLVGTTGEQEPFLRLAVKVATHAWCGMEVRTRCYQVIAESAAPLQARRAHALQIIEEESKWGDIPPALMKLLDASVFERLRKMIRRSSDPDTFHYGAAAALSYLGDREIVSDLERLRPAFRAKHVNLEGTLVHYLWRIRAQDPPSKLLDYITSTENLENVAGRLWCIRRATELGISRDDIRQAILSHAQKVQPSGEYAIRPGLTTIKAVALELGVLVEDDLPGVRVPEQAPTP